MNRAVRQYSALPVAQRGAAVLLLVLILAVSAASYFLVKRLNGNAINIERDKITAAALAQAKEALIGYAAGVKLTGSARPGDLPCPDMDGNGFADSSCGDSNGSSQEKRLGRLPYKTLKLPDIRDGYGERLWYAVSTDFKNNTRSNINLNSDTPGTITIRSSAGTVINDGAGATGVIATVIAPGPALQRWDGLTQIRDNINNNDPRHYLDCRGNSAGVCNIEDNAAFTDHSASDGFIHGPIYDVARNIVVNDHLIAITSEDLMPRLGQRVTSEALNCLLEYAAKPQNNGRYPWAAKLDPGGPPNYIDTSNQRIGRIPDTPFNTTRSDSGNTMDNDWTASCKINSNSGWWPNWKEVVFYAIADGYKPVNTSTSPGCGSCMVINSPDASTDKQVIAISAGKAIPSLVQHRASNSDKGTITNYLEGENSILGNETFEQQHRNATFNDILRYHP